MKKLILLGFILFIVGCKQDENIFKFEKELKLKGTPDQLFELITGDISEWWDHSFSEKPDSLYIEQFAGGGFYEIFNDGKSSVKHAEVIYSDPGKYFRFTGPLGLSGKAVQMVHTYEFIPVGTDSTIIHLEVHATGEIDEEMIKIVSSVWDHFLFERFKPYAEKKLK